MLGIISAFFSMAILGFSSWGCYQVTSDISSIILYIVMAVSILGGIIPAVMLIRKTQGKFIAIAIALSFIVTLAGNGIYLFYNLKIC